MTVGARAHSAKTEVSPSQHSKATLITQILDLGRDAPPARSQRDTRKDGPLCSAETLSLHQSTPQKGLRRGSENVAAPWLDFCTRFTHWNGNCISRQRAEYIPTSPMPTDGGFTEIY